MTTPKKILNDNVRQEVERRLRDMKDPVTVRLFTQSSAASLLVPGRECVGCVPTQQLLQELTELTDKIRLEVVDFHANQAEALKHGVERIPCTLIGNGESFPFRYYGLPTGYEFATLLDALVRESRDVSRLMARNRKRLREIEKDITIQVFVTPT